jgi:AraC-like DNA-binding protein
MIASPYNALSLIPDKGDRVRVSAHLGKSYRLFNAASERELIHTVRGRIIDLVIGRLGSNGTEGARLWIRLKSSPEHAHIPMILVIPDDNPSARRVGLEAGADVCLEQSLSRKWLKVYADNLIANRVRVRNSLIQFQSAPARSVSRSAPHEAFRSRLDHFIADNLASLDVDALARGMNMSRPTLYRKVRSVSSMTPNALIKTSRLNKAAELICCADYTISEVVRLVGFRSRSNFGKAFLKQFKVTPVEFRSTPGFCPSSR